MLLVGRSRTVNHMFSIIAIVVIVTVVPACSGRHG
jgi:hypothetical protein